MPETTDRPWFTGLEVHRDLTYRYSLLYPDGWNKFELESDGGKGFILTPSADPDDVTTSLSVEARDIGTTVTGDDLPTLREGVLKGLKQLHGVKIESQEDDAIGDLVTMEFRFTFRETKGEPPRKRWLRLAYKGTTQVRLIAQGADEAQFEYWLPMFYQAIRTFQFADWWAEFSGHSWQPSLMSNPYENDES